MSQVTTHVLDTAQGRPAAGVAVSLERDGDVVARARTGPDGRSDLGPDLLEPATYSLRFDTAARSSFFPEVVVAFAIADDAHVHVPLLLSPFGYSTYRGS